MNEEAILQAAATIYAGGLSQQLIRQCGKLHPLERITKAEAVTHALELASEVRKLMSCSTFTVQGVWPDAMPAKPAQDFAAGDKVAFNGMHPSFAWALGRVGTVKGFTPEGTVLTVEGWAAGKDNLLKLREW